MRAVKTRFVVLYGPHRPADCGWPTFTMLRVARRYARHLVARAGAQWAEVRQDDVANDPPTPALARWERGMSGTAIPVTP